jgi:hypothetical protein
MTVNEWAVVPFLAFGSSLLLACGSRSDLLATGAGTAPTANGQPYACATHGATYVLTYADLVAPGCGPVPAQTLNVSTDGSVPTGVISCASMDIVGCTTTGNGCVSSRHFPGPPVAGPPGTCTSGYSITFSSDGSVVTGQATIHCTLDSYACDGSYSVTGNRQ